MHATISSTSMLVPTIAIAYSHKIPGVIGEVLGNEYIIDIRDEFKHGSFNPRNKQNLG